MRKLIFLVLLNAAAYSSASIADETPFGSYLKQFPELIRCYTVRQNGERVAIIDYYRHEINIQNGLTHKKARSVASATYRTFIDNTLYHGKMFGFPGEVQRWDARPPHDAEKFAFGCNGAPTATELVNAGQAFWLKKANHSPN